MVKFIYKALFNAKNLIGVFKQFTKPTITAVFLSVIIKFKLFHIITETIIAENDIKCYIILFFFLTDRMNKTESVISAMLNITEYFVGNMLIVVD